MRQHTSVDTNEVAHITTSHAALPAHSACITHKEWRPVKVCSDCCDPTATVHEHNVHKRADELVQLVRNAIVQHGNAAFSVSTHDVFVHQGSLKLKVAVLGNVPPSSAAWPTLLDGNNAMQFPAIYGLLCTIFEWFRVTIGGQWSLGPYDMRHWTFMHGVAPVPYVSSRDKNAPQYELCARTGFRRWTAAGMLHQLRTRYCVNAHTLSYLALAVPSTSV